MRTAHGNKYHFLFFQRSRSRRAYLPERYNFPGVLGATVLGALIAIAGYTLGKVYVYSTWEYAMLKLPFEILQAFIGSAIGLFLWKNRKWGQMIRRFLGY